MADDKLLLEASQKMRVSYRVIAVKMKKLKQVKDMRVKLSVVAMMKKLTNY